MVSDRLVFHLFGEGRGERESKWMIEWDMTEKVLDRLVFHHLGGGRRSERVNE